jgi:BirA family biotin operon repressor/biotin-[acetyl-CoA-carboxylase] ligase
MRQRILEMLMDSAGVYVSGEQMSVRLGISRAAVWKHVKALERRGYEIESVSGLGYRLSAIPDILDSNTIGLGLKTQRFGRNLETYETIDSTNSRANIGFGRSTGRHDCHCRCAKRWKGKDGSRMDFTF